MGSFRLQKACCCLSLRTGNLVLGWFGLVLSSSSLLAGIAVLLMDYPNMKSQRMTREDIKFLLLIVLILVSFMNVCVFISHLYGSYKYRKSYLKPFLVIGGIQLVFQIGSPTHAIITHNHHEFVAEVISFLFAFYFYLIPLSFYKEIRDGHTPVEHSQVVMELR